MNDAWDAICWPGAASWSVLLEKLEGIVLENTVIKFECDKGVYSIILRELTKEQFEATLEALQIPVVFVNGDVSQPAIDGFKRFEEDPLA